MASVYKKADKGDNYYAKWKDHNGTWQIKCTFTTDKRAAQRIAAKYEADAALRREGVIDATDDRFAEQSRKPLSQHLADYKAVLTARQNTAKHVRMTARHIEAILTECKAELIIDLTGADVTQAIDAIRKAGDLKIKDEANRGTLSLSACNAHLRSIKSFTRWLWTEKRCPHDPLVGLSAFNTETDKRHVRRELTAAERDYLLTFVETHTTENHNLAGPDRAMVYRVALGTGFRANELRSLTPESFDLEAEPPTITVAAAYSKRRRKDCQPIRDDLAAMLKPWLRERPAGEQVFGGMANNTARMLRADLASARMAWINETAEGTVERAEREKSDFLTYQNATGEIADFHSTRHTYVSELAASGVAVKTVQELARHSTPNLTFGTYAHARKEDLSAALNSLPAENQGYHQGYQTEHQTLRESAASREETQLLQSSVDAATSTESATEYDVMPLNTLRDEQRRWSELNRRWRICNPLP